MVISRLEEEAEATRTQNERTADARIKSAQPSPSPTDRENILLSLTFKGPCLVFFLNIIPQVLRYSTSYTPTLTTNLLVQ